MKISDSIRIEVTTLFEAKDYASVVALFYKHEELRSVALTDDVEVTIAAFLAFSFYNVEKYSETLSQAIPIIKHLEGEGNVNIGALYSGLVYISGVAYIKTSQKAKAYSFLKSKLKSHKFADQEIDTLFTNVKMLLAQSVRKSLSLVVYTLAVVLGVAQFWVHVFNSPLSTILSMILLLLSVAFYFRHNKIEKFIYKLL